jgi:predicted acylesterase/phospholipase RssA
MLTGYHKTPAKLYSAVVANEMATSKPYVFRSYNHNWDMRNVSPVAVSDVMERDTTIWEAARATSAAPNYFNPMVINYHRYVDGGIDVNNPAEVLWKEFEGSKIGVLVSMGTHNTRPLSKDRFRCNSWYGSLRGFDVELMKDRQSSQVHSRMVEVTAESKTPYFRFDIVDGLGKISLDSWGKTTMGVIRDISAAHVKQDSVAENLRKCAKILVRSRRGDPA